MAICVWLLCFEDSTLFAGEARCCPQWEWYSPASWKRSRSPSHPPRPLPGATAQQLSQHIKCNTGLKSQSGAGWWSLLHCKSNGWDGARGHAREKAQGRKRKDFTDRESWKGPGDAQKSQEEGGGEIEAMWVDHKDHELSRFSWSTQNVKN